MIAQTPMAQARSRKKAAKGTLKPQIRIMFRKAIAMGPGICKPNPVVVTGV